MFRTKSTNFTMPMTTGIKDKNGKAIKDGDTVKYTAYYDVSGAHTFIGKVKYSAVYNHWVVEFDELTMRKLDTINHSTEIVL